MVDVRLLISCVVKSDPYNPVKSGIESYEIKSRYIGLNQAE